MKVEEGVMYVVWRDNNKMVEVDGDREELFNNLINKEDYKVEDFESDVILKYYNYDDIVKVIYDKRYNKEEVMKEIKIIDIEVFG